MTIDSLENELRENRKVMRGIPEALTTHKRLAQRNQIVGSMIAAIKEGKDPREVARAAEADLKAKGLWVD